MLPADEEASYSEGSHFEKHFFLGGGGDPKILWTNSQKNSQKTKKKNYYQYFCLVAVLFLLSEETTYTIWDFFKTKILGEESCPFSSVLIGRRKHSGAFSLVKNGGCPQTTIH